jgi:hypothetical protein
VDADDLFTQVNPSAVVKTGHYSGQFGQAGCRHSPALHKSAVAPLSLLRFERDQHGGIVKLRRSRFRIHFVFDSVATETDSL